MSTDPRPPRSKQASFRERLHHPITNHQVIKHTDVDERQRLLETARDELIRLARFRYTAWMIVSEDHGRRIVSEGALDHLTRVNACPVDRSAKQLLAGEDAIAVVDVQACEYFVLEACEAHRQVLARDSRA